MTEQVILLDGIDPLVMLGPNNRLLDQIQGYYPKVRLIARGNEIKCVGEADEVAVFAARMNELIEYYRRYNRIEEGTLRGFFSMTITCVWLPAAILRMHWFLVPAAGQ